MVRSSLGRAKNGFRWPKMGLPLSMFHLMFFDSRLRCHFLLQVEGILDGKMGADHSTGRLLQGRGEMAEPSDIVSTGVTSFLTPSPFQVAGLNYCTKSRVSLHRWLMNREK